MRFRYQDEGKGMTRTYALLKLLDLGPLNRKEIRDITGWPEKDLKHVIKGCAMNDTIKNVNRQWYRCIDGVLQTNNL